jgi:pimeloyl-ACP methyl ester carboxylesterase
MAGTGPYLVLIHGYLSSLHYWTAARPRLEARYTVVSIDLLGFGASPKPAASSYNPAEQLAWIDHTLDHLGIAGSITLAGHSMGALLALEYAHRGQRPVAKLVLLNMPLFASPQQARAELAGTNLFYRWGLYAGGHTAIWPLLRGLVHSIPLWLVLPRRHQAALAGWVAPTAPARRSSLRRIIEQSDAIANLNTLNIPTELVIGAGDRPIYQQNLTLVRPNRYLTTSIIAGKHHLLLARPQLMNDYL